MFEDLHEYELIETEKSYEPDCVIADYLGYSDGKTIYDDLIAVYVEWKRSNNISICSSWVIKHKEIFDIINAFENKTDVIDFLKFRLFWIVSGNIEYANHLYIKNKLSRIKYVKKASRLYDIATDTYRINGIKIKTSVFEFAETWIYENYCLKDWFEPDLDATILDIGAYYGETSLWFAQRLSSHGRVIAFEPISEHVKMIKTNVINNGYDKVIDVVNIGVWDMVTKKYMVMDGPESMCVEEKAGISINVTSLDNFFLKQQISKIDYIKMDIEGNEMKALLGAEAIIRKFKPKLAICVYHNFYDIYNVVDYLKSIVPEYNFYLSQKVTLPMDTILFVK